MKNRKIIRASVRSGRADAASGSGMGWVHACASDRMDGILTAVTINLRNGS
jgi:hypothetical protein